MFMKEKILKPKIILIAVVVVVIALYVLIVLDYRGQQQERDNIKAQIDILTPIFDWRPQDSSELQSQLRSAEVKLSQARDFSTAGLGKISSLFSSSVLCSSAPVSTPQGMLSFEWKAQSAFIRSFNK